MSDIDGDGKVSGSDLALLKALLSQSGYDAGLFDRLSPEERARLDVNRDGAINYDDVVRLGQMLLKVDQAEARQLAERFQALRDKNR